jgi:serine/threonine-protein kinase
VPNVIGMFKGPAGIELGEVGFHVKVVEQPEAGYDPGKVFDQDPAADTKAKKGTVVTIIVATPVPTTEPPSTSTSTTTTTIPPTSSTTGITILPPITG